MSKECCSTNEKPLKKSNNAHPEHEGHEHNHSHEHDERSPFQMFLPALISFTLLLIGIAFDYLLKPVWFNGFLRFALYFLAYIPVGFPVMKEAFSSIKNGDFFSEFLLMTIATVGAFSIGEYPEGVAVMLFYSVGEVFQTMAVQKAQLNIKTLLDQRPDEITVLENNIPKTLKAEKAEIGQIIQLKPGEKLALDGELISETAAFNTAALTGESKPDSLKKGDPVLAGMINLNTVSLVKINTLYEDSKLSKILQLVQNAASQKAKTELFIRKFAKIYTPIVVFLAIGICFLPYFFFNGSNFLDILANIQNVVMDKTGTMTEGVFKVQDVLIEKDFNQQEILQYLNAVESKSTHPIATAVHEFVGEIDHKIAVENLEEIAGHGLKGNINGKEFLAGNFKLMEKFAIPHHVNHIAVSDTLIAMAYDGKFAGYLTISDQIKEDAAQTVAELKKLGIKTTMLSGDKSSVVLEVAQKLGITNAFGDLLPEDKVNKMKEMKARNESVAFVGDGVNDAPVVALSDVGMAMGGLGSDATIETADIVIQDDKPSKIPMAIRIGKETKKIVWQNIALAFGVKAIVLVLGAGGLATMWEAVFADVGVALLAILNAVRIQNMNFSKN